MELLRKFFRLSWSEQFLLIRVSFLVGATRLGLWLFSLKTVQRVLVGASAKPTRRWMGRDAYCRRVIWAVYAVGRLLGDKPCLPQALVTQWLLRRKGYPATLHIGVKKGAPDQLMAHAWVESEGEIIMGGHASPQVYTPLHSFE